MFQVRATWNGPKCQAKLSRRPGRVDVQGAGKVHMWWPRRGAKGRWWEGKLEGANSEG